MQDCMMSDTLNFEPPVILFRYWTVQEIIGFVSPLLGASQLESTCLIACILVIFHWAQKKQLQACCVLLRSPSLVFPDVQWQLKSCDCGLIALAYASSVCGNLDPATINTIHDRVHTESYHHPCLANGRINKLEMNFWEQIGGVLGSAGKDSNSDFF